MKGYILLCMENVSSKVALGLPGNVVFIEFYDKSLFPKGIWRSEPDLCKWEAHSLVCLAIRDMTLGMWRGFVKLTNDHPAFNKSFKELLNSNMIDHVKVHGGLATIGKLPKKYKEYNLDAWWIGFECTQGEDYLPLLKTDPEFNALQNGQTYKTLQFVRTETVYLAKQLSRIKSNE